MRCVNGSCAASETGSTPKICVASGTRDSRAAWQAMPNRSLPVCTENTKAKRPSANEPAGDFPRAAEDLEEIGDYIAVENPAAAMRLMDRFKEISMTLRD